MPPLPPDRLTLLTRRFQTVLQGIGDHSSRQVQGVWSKLDGYDESNIAAFARKSHPILTAAKTVSVSHAVGYYSTAAGIAPIGVPARAVPVELDPRLPFISTWNALKAGQSFENAVAAGFGRAEAVVRDFVTSSARQTGDQVVERGGLRVVGWERIPDGGACDWCLEVADQVYTSAESADFGHDRCSCTAAPIFA